MRENRTHGSEGGESGSTGLPYPYRIIGMSTQFGCFFNGYEAWANMPSERKKMVDLIRRTKTEGVIFVSGDTHWSEVACAEEDGVYPFYDFTSSSINQHWDPSSSQVRVGPAYGHPNFGMLDIDWESKDPSITYQVFDEKDQEQLNVSIRLSQLNFDEANLKPAKSIESIQGTWQSAFGEIDFAISDNSDATSDGDSRRVSGDGTKWSAKYEKGTCELTQKGQRLVGTWTEGTGDSQRTGECEFTLFRSGEHVRGVYGRGDKPKMLAWPCWQQQSK